MYFRVNLKMRKPMLCCCYTWIVFIEPNFTVAFLLIRKTWDDWFPGKLGGCGILRNGGDHSNGGRFWNGRRGKGSLISLCRLCSKTAKQTQLQTNTNKIYIYCLAITAVAMSHTLCRMQITKAEQISVGK